VCYFVTLGVQQAGVAAVTRIGTPQSGLQVRPSRNSSVAAAFPRGDVLFQITDGHCSCDLFSGATGKSARDEARHRERYRRKGWSETKVSRALEAKRAVHQAGKRARFRDAVASVVRQVRDVRLLSHMYSGGVDTEKVQPGGRQSVTLEAFLAADGTFPEDIVVNIGLEAG
jgi:hypothetical protein